MEDTVFSNDPTFTKGPGGEATAVGQHVSEQAGTRGQGRIAGGRLIAYQVLLVVCVCVCVCGHCAFALHGAKASWHSLPGWCQGPGFDSRLRSLSSADCCNSAIAGLQCARAQLGRTQAKALVQGPSPV